MTSGVCAPPQCEDAAADGAAGRSETTRFSVAKNVPTRFKCHRFNT